MKTRWKIRGTGVLLAIVVCGSLALSACGLNTGGSGSTGGSSGGGTPTATRAPKAKPTGVPVLTVPDCTQLLTVAEANTFMKPPTPATTIRVDNGPSGGSCNYEYAQFKSVVTVTFLPYKGLQTPQDEQHGLKAAASQISSVQGATVTTTMVSGVGDAALFASAALASPPLKFAALDVIYGALVVSCANFNVGASSLATQQTALTQVCQQLISRL
jgi:hypothetical protein